MIVFAAQAIKTSGEWPGAEMRPPGEHTTGRFSRRMRIDDIQTKRYLRIVHEYLQKKVRVANTGKSHCWGKREGADDACKIGDLQATEPVICIARMPCCKVYEFGYNQCYSMLSFSLRRKFSSSVRS